MLRYYANLSKSSIIIFISYYIIIMKRTLNLATSSFCKEERREMLEIASECALRLEEFWGNNPQDPLLAAYKLELNLLSENLTISDEGHPKMFNDANKKLVDIPLICSHLSSYIYSLAVCVKQQNAPLIL